MSNELMSNLESLEEALQSFNEEYKNTPEFKYTTIEKYLEQLNQLLFPVLRVKLAYVTRTVSSEDTIKTFVELRNKELNTELPNVPDPLICEYIFLYAPASEREYEFASLYYAPNDQDFTILRFYSQALKSDNVYILREFEQDFKKHLNTFIGQPDTQEYFKQIGRIERPIYEALEA